MAALFLRKKGLRVMETQYRKSWGEIDLVCKDRDTWVFVEVKTRTFRRTPGAIDALTPRKCRRIQLAAMSYMNWKRILGEPARFDVVLIEEGLTSWYQDVLEISSRYTC